jgi:hypothetical protein
MHAQRLTDFILILTSLCSLQSGLGDGSLSITVDHNNTSASCDSLWSEGEAKYCDSLQQVLSFIANTSKSAGIGNDSNFVDVHIAEGRYELADPVINIEQNIMLRAKTPGTVVTVSMEKQELGCNDSSASCHGLLIINVRSVIIEGITFERSEGIITFENVSRVTISNSKFR